MGRDSAVLLSSPTNTNGQQGLGAGREGGLPSPLDRSCSGSFAAAAAAGGAGTSGGGNNNNANVVGASTSQAALLAFKYQVINEVHTSVHFGLAELEALFEQFWQYSKPEYVTSPHLTSPHLPPLCRPPRPSLSLFTPFCTLPYGVR